LPLPLAREAAAALFFAALTLVQSGIWSDLGTRVYGGGHSDPGSDIWVIANVSRQLLSEPLRPFDGTVFYPLRNTVLYRDPLLGPAVLATPVRLVSDNPVLHYNAAVLLGVWLAAWGFYRLALSLHGDAVAALLAGVAIAFSSQQTARFWHINLLTISFFPFLVLGLLRLLARPGPGPAALTGLAFALQAGTSGYYAFCSFLLSLLLVLWHWRRLREPRVWLWLCVAVAVAVALLLPYVTGFAELQGEGQMTRGDQQQQRYSIELPWDMLGSRSYLWAPVLGSIGKQFFPGLTVLVLAAFAFRRGPRAPLGPWALIAAVFLLLSFGPEVRVLGRSLGPGPFGLLVEAVPFLDAMRHPMTFALGTLIALGVMASFGLSRIRSPWLRGLALVAATAETLGAPPPRTPADLALPAVYRYLASQPEGALLELPFGELRWVWWSTFHGRSIVNGGGAYKPHRYRMLRGYFQRTLAEGEPLETSRFLAFLKAWFPVRYVVLHAEAPPELREAFGAASASLERVHETSAGDRVYRLRRGGRGTRLVRVFRGDQLASGTLTATLRGPAGGRVTARLRDVPLGHAVLSPEWSTHAWTLPGVEAGLNIVELSGEGGSEFELREIEAR
jgi:hypothetical protein